MDLSKLTEPFPESALKWRWADKNQTRKLTYVEGHVYIRRVNEVTGNNWSMEVKDITTRDFGNGQLVVARVAVTIPEHGTREGLGVQAVHERGGEDLVKGALTDALKNALKYFGVGLELYGPDYEGVDQVTGEIRPMPQQARRAPMRPDARLPREQQEANLEALAPSPRHPEPAQPANGQQRPTAGPGLASESQIRYLHGLAAAANPDPDVTPHDFLRGQHYARFRVEHTNELTKAQGSQLIDWLAKKDLVTAEYPPAPGDPVEAAQRGLDGMPEEPQWVRDAPGADAYTR